MWPFPIPRGRRYYYTITSTKVINLKVGKGCRGYGTHPLNVPSRAQTHVFVILGGMLGKQSVLWCWVSTAFFSVSMLQPCWYHRPPTIPLVCCCLTDKFCYLEICFFLTECVFERFGWDHRDAWLQRQNKEFAWFPGGWRGGVASFCMSYLKAHNGCLTRYRQN